MSLAKTLIRKKIKLCKRGIKLANEVITYYQKEKKKKDIDSKQRDMFNTYEKAQKGVIVTHEKTIKELEADLKKL